MAKNIGITLTLVVIVFLPVYGFSFVYDNFDGNSIDYSLWDVSLLSETSSNVSVSDGYLNISAGDYVGDYVTFNSTLGLIGDFDLILKYDNFIGGFGVGDTPGVSFFASAGIPRIKIERNSFYNNYDYDYFSSFASGQYTRDNDIDASTDFGHLKISKVGSSVSTFYKENSDWFELAFYQDLFTLEATHFGFQVYTADDGRSSISIDSIEINPHPAPVPEPSTFLLLSGGLAGLAFAVRRRRKE